MRLMTSVLDRVLDSFADTASSKARRARKSAIQQAILETLEPRMLMSGNAILAAINPTVTYGTPDLNGHVTATVQWTNRQTASRGITVEVEEDHSKFSNSYSAWTSLLDGSTSTATLTLDADASYHLRIRSIGNTGSVYSQPLATTTPTWNALSLSAGVTHSDPNINSSYSPDAEIVTVDDSNYGGEYTLLVRAADSPFPDRWGVARAWGNNEWYPDYGAGTSTAQFLLPHCTWLDYPDGSFFPVALSGNLQFAIVRAGDGNAFRLTDTPTYTCGTPTGYTITPGNWISPTPPDSPPYVAAISSWYGAPYENAAGQMYGGHEYDMLYAVENWHTSKGVWFDLSQAAVPVNVQVHAASEHSAVLTWVNTADDENGFEIQRSYDGSTNWTTVGTTGVDVSEFTDIGLVPFESYYYRVRATRSDANLDSPWTELYGEMPTFLCWSCDGYSVLQPAAGESGPTAEGSSGGASALGGNEIQVASIGDSGGFTGESFLWSNGNNSMNIFGNGVDSTQTPTLQMLHNGRIVIESSSYRLYFNSNYSPIQGNPFSLTRLPSGEFVVTDGQGDFVKFSSAVPGGQGAFEESSDGAGNTVTATYGTGLNYTITQTLAGGHSQSYQHIFSGNQLCSVVLTQDNHTTAISTLVFQYYTANSQIGNVGDLERVSKATSTGSLNVTYLRYSGTGSSYADALTYVVKDDAYDAMLQSQNLVNPNGTASLNTQILTVTSNQLAGIGSTVVANFADNAYLYDSAGRVISIRNKGAGCSACTGGFGTTTFDYAASSFTNPNSNTWVYKRTEYLPGFDASNTTSTLNTEVITYSNAAGQTILQVTSQPATGTKWMDYYAYDAQGNVVLHAHPSAVIGYDEEYPDLVDPNVGYPSSGYDFWYISNDSGLIEGTDYEYLYAGSQWGVAVQDTYIMQGDGGGSTPVKHYQSYYEYDTSFGFYQNGTYEAQPQISRSVVFSGDVTGYPSTYDASAQVTQYDYTWQTGNGTAFVSIIQTTQPEVSTANNDMGTSAISYAVMDGLGRTILTIDADGFANYTGYDPVTGVATESIVDAASNLLPSSLITTLNNASIAYHTSGLNLITTYGIDSLGRTTKVTDPNGNVSYTIYDDAHHAVFSLNGASLTLSSSGTAGTLTATGPISMSRGQIPYQYQQYIASGTTGSTVTLTGMYSESMTFSGKLAVKVDDAANGVFGIPASDWGSTTGNSTLFNLLGTGSAASPQFVIQSLSRSLANAGSQTVESDSYFNINDSTYLATGTASAYSGLASPFAGSTTANFYATLYGYNAQGNQARTVSPTGTIADTITDALGRALATFVGTNDVPSSDLNGDGVTNWEDFTDALSADPSMIPDGTNMVMVSSEQYDNGGVGDSNLTQTTQYSNSNSDNNQTDYVYDWRDRLVTTIQGVGEQWMRYHLPVTVNILDNLGEVLGTYKYDNELGTDSTDSDGNGIPDVLEVTSDGVPTAPTLTGSNLVSAATFSYDEQGRRFRSTAFSVDSVDGSFSTSSSDTIVSNTWFDHRGDAIATYTSGGIMTKRVYDGAGRVTIVYTTDGGALNNTSAPGTIRGAWADVNSVNNDIVLSQVEYTFDKNSNVILTTDREAFHNNATTSTGALLGPTDSGPAARVSYVLDYYDATNRLTESVNLGTNGGVNLTIIPTAPTTSSDTILATFYGFDVAGNRSTLRDSRDIVTSVTFDNLGRQTSVTVNSTSTDSSQIQTTAFTYDGAGHILTKTLVMPIGTPSQTTSYIYGVTTYQGSAINSNDLLYRVEYPVASGDLAGQPGTTSADMETYTYDAEGNINSKTDRNGNLHWYSHDSVGRVIYDGASTAPTVSMDYTMDNPWTLQDGAYFATSTTDPELGAGFADNGVVALTGMEGDSYGGAVKTFTLGGGTYALSMLAAKPSGSTNTIEVYVDGNIVGTFSPTSGTFASYVTSDFTVSSGSHTILLQSTDADKVYINDVTVGTPLPSDNRLPYPAYGGATFDTTPRTITLSGGTYQIGFYVSNSNSPLLEVVVDGHVVDSLTSGYSGQNYTSNFTLSSGSHTFVIDTGTYSGYGTYPSDVYLYPQDVNVADADFQSAILDNGNADYWIYNGSAGPTLVDSNNKAGVLESTSGSAAGSISQKVLLTLGTYAVTFDAAVRSGDSQGIHVSISGTDLGTVNPTSTWSTYGGRQFTITTAGIYTLTFSATASPSSGDNIAYLDNVQLLGDVLSLQLSPNVSVGVIVANQEIDYSYNALGLLSDVSTYDSNWNVASDVFRTYNGFGQLTGEYQQHGDYVDTRAVLYTYANGNQGSRLVSMTYPDGTELNYNYGTPGSLNYVIGRLDNLSQDATPVESYRYLGLSTVVERDEGSGVNLTYIGTPTSSGTGAGDIYSGLDRFGRVVDQKWTTGTNGSSGTVIDEYTYTYDRDSNVTQKKNVTALQTPYAYSSFDEGYTYDGLNRLVAVSRLLGGASGNQSFALDPLGNITSVTTDGTAVARSSNSDNQLVSINGNALAYDANGNMTTDDQGDTYVYDAWNRMVAVNNSSGALIAAYTYDALGRRITETTINGDHVPVTTDLYYSAAWQVLEESQGGQTVLRNVWSPVYVNALVLRDRDTDGNGTQDERVYATQDANFNVTGLVGTSGGVLEHFVYQAGGLHVTTDNAWTVQSGETLKWQVTYQGGEEDLATGLINFQERDYNLRTLTWNTQDPIQAGANWHSFCDGNAINRVDPSGLAWIHVSNLERDAVGGRWHAAQWGKNFNASLTFEVTTADVPTGQAQVIHWVLDLWAYGPCDKFTNGSKGDIKFKQIGRFSDATSGIDGSGNTWKDAEPGYGGLDNLPGGRAGSNNQPPWRAGVEVGEVVGDTPFFTLFDTPGVGIRFSQAGKDYTVKQLTMRANFTIEVYRSSTAKVEKIDTFTFGFWLTTEHGPNYGLNYDNTSSMKFMKYLPSFDGPGIGDRVA